MTTDAERLQIVHFISQEAGKLSSEFEVDPTKIYEVKPEKGSNGRNHPEYRNFRYVVAIGGGTAEERKKAVDDFHEQVLAYPTKHGIIPSKNITQKGVAQLLLNSRTSKAKTPEGKTIAGDLSERSKSRIENLRAQLHGHRMFIIRGAFESPEAFAIALTQAAQSRPEHHHPNISDFHLPARPTVHDTLYAGANALKMSAGVLETVGIIAKRNAPNTPFGNAAIAGARTLQDAGRAIRDFADSRHPFVKLHMNR